MKVNRRATPWVVLVCLAAGGCAAGSDAPDPEAPSATPSASSNPSRDPTPSDGFIAGGGLDPSTPPETTEPAPEPDAEGPPGTYTEAVDRFAAAFREYDIPQEFSRFETPSGNIYCVLDDPGIPVGCEIGEGGVRDDAECIEAPSPVVGRIEFTDRGFVPVCNSDTIRTPGPPILGYGGVASVTGLPFQCVSEEIGVTCISTAQAQGFFIARGRYQIF